jgi:hypothetical protein
MRRTLLTATALVALAPPAKARHSHWQHHLQELAYQNIASLLAAEPAIMTAISASNPLLATVITNLAQLEAQTHAQAAPPPVKTTPPVSPPPPVVASPAPLPVPQGIATISNVSPQQARQFLGSTTNITAVNPTLGRLTCNGSAPLTNTFGVTTAGFVDPNGKAWNARGLNANVQDVLAAWPNLMQIFSGMTMVRLNVVPTDTQDAINEAVLKLTGSGVVTVVETHYGSTNLDTYKQWAKTFKDNPLVFLETPNEPSGSVASDQISVIQTIRAAGFNNPIGIQPIGGWDQANIPQVAAAVGTNNLYVTPHIYYNGTDPNAANAYVQSEIATAAKSGMFAVVDEFGNALDGFTKDPLGDTVIQAAIAANKAGQAGAVFWAMDNGNHPDGTDSTFATPDGSKLTPIGQDMIKPWLDGVGTVVAPSACPSPSLSNATPQTSMSAADALAMPKGVTP